MSDFKKILLVAVGYIASVIGACLVVYLYELTIPLAASQASSGMYAFGDMLYFMGALVLFSVVPTALALYFLRMNAWFWNLFSFLALAVAVTAPAAEAINTFIRYFHLDYPYRPNQFDWDILGFFCLMRVFGTPLLAGGFALFSFIAPDKKQRRRLILATVIEAVVFIYVLAYFLLWQHFA